MKPDITGSIDILRFQTKGLDKWLQNKYSEPLKPHCSPGISREPLKPHCSLGTPHLIYCNEVTLQSQWGVWMIYLVWIQILQINPPSFNADGLAKLGLKHGSYPSGNKIWYFRNNCFQYPMIIILFQTV